MATSSSSSYSITKTLRIVLSLGLFGYLARFHCYLLTLTCKPFEVFFCVCVQIKGGYDYIKLYGDLLDNLEELKCIDLGIKGSTSK